ncbi:MAG: hypothetical protein J1F27_03905 [Prevotellaceae bacterium]|nr:hypothetical protein [Prevotellaceae bacterium]
MIRLRIQSAVLLLAGSLMLLSCNDEEVNSKYCNLRARLTIDNVLQAPVLHAACESMGEYCTVTSDGQSFIFTNAAGKSSSLPIAALSGYSGYNLGLTGFIVGRLTIPEMGEDNVRVVCFDRACPNCYQAYNITKPLALQESGYAGCKSCNRTYNLNDCGSLSDGPAGRALYRYRVNYTLNNIGLWGLYINN